VRKLRGSGVFSRVVRRSSEGAAIRMVALEAGDAVAGGVASSIVTFRFVTTDKPPDCLIALRFAELRQRAIDGILTEKAPTVLRLLQSLPTRQSFNWKVFTS
jgi:hypothetical protein